MLKLTLIINFFFINFLFAINFEDKLYIASKENNIKELKSLLEIAKDNINELRSSSILHWSIENNFDQLALLLINNLEINYQEDLNSRDNLGDTPLTLAIYYEKDNIIKALMNKNKKLINLPGELDYPPLHRSIYLKNFNLIKFLLSNSETNINLQETNSGFTPLHLAASHGQAKIVKLLLLFNAKTQIKDLSNKTALEIAKNYSQVNLNCNLFEAIKKAFRLILKKDYEQVIFLLSNFETLKEELFNAIKENNKDKIKDIITKIPSGVKDHKGNNILHQSILNNNKDIVKYILSINPKLVTLKNNNNQTPIDLAVYNIKILKLFFKIL